MIRVHGRYVPRTDYAGDFAHGGDILEVTAVEGRWASVKTHHGAQDTVAVSWLKAHWTYAPDSRSAEAEAWLVPRDRQTT